MARKAKRVFLSSVSHELRSPLHGLLASTELMIDDGHLTPFQDVCTRTISNCGKTLCDVIEHVLSFSDADAIVKSLERVDLLTFVEEVLDATWAGKAKAKAKGPSLEVLVKVNLTHLRHPFLINRGEIGRIIMNLFGNSIKYTSQGYLSVTVTAAAPPFHADGHRKQFVSLIFEDTGKGIEEKFMPNIFTPFMQENDQSEGVGLGMSLVKQIVEKSGGTIEVRSVHGKGTTVEVTLLLEALKVEKLADTNGEFLSLRDLKFSVFLGANKTASDILVASLVETCTSTFAMVRCEPVNADVILLVDPNDLDELRRLKLLAPIVIFALVSQQAEPRQTMFLQVPVGPYKLGRAIKTAIEAVEQTLYQVRRSSIVHLDPISPPTSAPMKQYDPMSLEHFVNQGETIRASPQTDASTPPSEVSSFSFGRPKIDPLQMIRDDTQLSTAFCQKLRICPYCLCVDDNVINVTILAALLKKEGLDFDTACDGRQAVEKFISSERPFDLVFMDINMPVLDGMSATAAIRKHEKEVTKRKSVIVALTGGGELEERDITEAGFDYFFKKPVSMKQLSGFLKKLENQWGVSISDA